MNAALMKVIYISQIVYVHVSGAGRADFLFSVSAQKQRPAEEATRF